MVVKDSDIEVLKGQIKTVESYSGFGGDGEETGLTQKLKDLGVTKVYCCGLAYDYCVGSTAESSGLAGFETYLLKDAARSVAQPTADLMNERLDKAGVKQIEIKDI